jgi:hypothetical protein
MFRSILIIFGRLLKSSKKNNSRVFWPFILLLTLTVLSFNEGQFQKNQNSAENNLSSILYITPGGGDESQGPNFFVPPNTPTGSGNGSLDKDSFTNSEPINERPKLLWGVDPSYRAPIGGGGSGNDVGSSGKDNTEEKYKIPDQSEWISDNSIWDSVQETDSSVLEQKEDKAPDKLKVDIDFPYQYDSNQNPTLLIPNTGRLREKRPYTNVEYDQTAAHMHHASDFDIKLTLDFNMAKYERLDRTGRLDYVNQKLPQETVINYQNAIGQSMCPLFNIPGKTTSVPGFAGKHKIGTELSIQQSPNGINMLSIILEDGTHISSFSITNDQLKRIINNDFWVLRDRNL